MNIHLFLLILLVAVKSLHADIADHFKPCQNKSGNHSMRNIDFIYLINLDRRPDRLADCSRRLDPYDIHPYRFSAVNGWELPIEVINDVGLKFEPWMNKGIMGTYYYLDEQNIIQHAHEIIGVEGRTYFGHCVARGPIAIALSHLSVLQDALNSGYNTVWVLEDDFELKGNPHIISELIDKLDSLVGKEGWDVLFTDRDIRKANGEHNPCYWAARRPNFTPWNPNQFAERKIISPDFQKIGARWGSHSMILRKSGIEKILHFFKVYRIFFPYDMDYIFPSDMFSEIQLYTVLEDVVSNQVDSVSDNSGPSYLEAKEN